MREEYAQGMKAWADKRHNAVNPYNINTVESQLWWGGFQKAMHTDYYGKSAANNE